MAVTPSNLLAPEGPVEPELFPGESEHDNTALITRLSGYIAQGVTKVAGYTDITEEAEVDEAVRVWALYLAFRAAHTLSLTRPAEDHTEVAVLGRTVYDEDQRKGLKDLANEYLAEFQILVVSATSRSAASPGIPSHQTSNEYDW